MHFTPTYSSWINQVERFFAYVTADLLQRSDHRSVHALEADLRLAPFGGHPDESGLVRGPVEEGWPSWGRNGSRIPRCIGVRQRVW